MATQFLNFTETPLNFKKLKKNPKNSNLKSFWAFLFSIFIYISVFYVFNLSPSTLLSTTKFWFLISNTLILIIAADFESYSVSKKHDFYDEYVKNNVTPKSTSIVPCFETLYDKSIVEETTPNHDQEKETGKEIVSIKDVYEEKLPVENKKEIVSVPENDQKNRVVDKKRKRKSKCGRSYSDKAIIISEGKEEKMDFKRTLSEINEETKIEENEFSSMSNEELNKRVEEFIQKFNKQIRLQAIRSRGDSELERID